jgi:hypothetical protein
LRGAWKNIAGVNFRLGKQTDEVDEIKVIHDNEMVMAFSIRRKAEKRATMHVVYPYVTLLPYMRILD